MLVTALPTARAHAADALGVAPVDFVILVDESGSLSAKDVAAERAAASLLVLGEVSDKSRAAVVGFGSSTGQGQAPVDTVCPLTRVDTGGREQLSACVSKLRRRTDAEGNGTDFPAALAQGLSLLKNSEADTPKIVFLLTDGRLDVSDSPAYGNDATSRNANAQKALRKQISQARSDRVQIWPLGFGSGIDRAQLDELASGGYQSRCANLSSARPTVHVAKGSSDVAQLLLTAFAGARCATATPGQSAPSVSSAADLKVTIPPVATDGSIAVVKQNPDTVAVTYYDPRGRKVPLHGKADGSEFDLVGQSGPVEALRIRNPYPGTWRVHVEVLGGAQAQRITASAIWQGVLRSYIVVDPPLPTAGQRVAAHVTLQTRQGVILTEPGQLTGINVSVKLTGDGFDARSLRLRDDGKGADSAANDGEFSAHVTVPRTATGALSFTGVMTGEGIAGDQRSYTTEVASATPLLTGAIVFEDRQVHPGGTAQGGIELRNNDTVAHRLRLALTGGSARSALTVTPQRMTVQAGQQVRVPLRLRFGTAADLGAVPGNLTVRDEASGQVVTQAFVTVRVVPVPDVLDRYGKGIGLAAALLLALLVVVGLRWQDRRRNRDASDIQLILYRGESEMSRLRAPARAGSEFGFSLRVGPGGTQRLLLDDSGGRYRVRRAGDGGLTVRLPGGERIAVPRGQRAMLTDGVSLGFADHRPATRAAGTTGTARSRVSGTRHGQRATPQEKPSRGGERSRKSATDSTTLITRRPYDDDF
ncbi:vWA domain-containing protein [Streptomyces sp. NPDC002755]|uniref:vWA domain-containing protein n=1 Tax=Streptomyces sp. NPDC002884 TaxID=3154544 RepID=UPI0033198AD9